MVQLDIVSFGEWIQTRRNQLGLTRKGLAELVVCSPVTIKKIERDERRPSPQIAELLAQHLQLPQSEHENFMARARGEFVSNFISPTELSIEEAQAPTSEEETPKHNLPPQLTPFFGRTQELAEIASQLANPNCRLLTILGAGGMGKTRLSIEAARVQIENFTDGITFVELAPIDANRSVREINPLASALADALGIGFHGESSPEQQLFDYLRRKEMLIVYDNFEHLVETVVFLSDLLSHAPDIKLLVTSRERLNLQEEWLYPLQGLSTPASDLHTSDAVQFFIERAKQVKPSFDSKAELAGIQRICQLVAGMPLGIELSASWALHLSCEEIADEIEEELDFLTTEIRNVPDRHRSIRAVWDYSWEKLTDKERTVLKKLSVFRGGFERKAAKEIAAASLSLLAKLVSKSLLSVGENGRYQIHELLRQFAAEKLTATPDQLRIVQQDHCHFYLSFIENQWRLPAKRKNGIETVSKDIDNVRKAIGHGLEHSTHSFTVYVWVALVAIFDGNAWHLEGLQTMEAIADALHPGCLSAQSNKSSTVAEACVHWACFQMGKGYYLGRLGKVHEAEAPVQQALHILSEKDLNLQQLRAYCHWLLAWVYWWQGHYLQAEVLYEKSAAWIRENDNSIHTFVLPNYAEGQVLVGNYSKAEQIFSEIEAMTHRSEKNLAYLLNLGHLNQYRGNYVEAKRLFKLMLARLHKASWPMGKVRGFLALGNLARLQGEFGEAYDYLQQAIIMSNEFNTPKYAARGHWSLGELAVDEGAFQAAKSHFANHEFVVGFSTGGPGWAYLGLGELAEAKMEFEKRLKEMVKSGSKPIGLHAIVGIAHLKAHSANFQEAISLLTLVKAHESSTFEAKEKASALFAELAIELPEAVVAAAVAQGNALELFETAVSLLAEG